MELLRYLAAAQAFLLALAAFAASDVESAAFAVLTVGLVLGTYWRRGTVAAGALGLVFLDVVFWMAPAAVNNAQHHERLATALGPALLAGVAGCGIAAVVLRLAIGADRADSVNVRVPAVVMAVVIGAVTVGTTVVSRSKNREPAAPAAATVIMHGVKFSPTTVSVPAAARIAVSNRDLFWHTFTVQAGRAGHVDVKVPAGGHRSVSLGQLPPGRYPFYCRIPGHRAAGMKGTLTVSG